MKIPDLYQKYLKTGRVSTDTRSIIPGSIFFALKGEKFDANKLAEEAIKKGASFAVIDNPEFKTSDQFLLVDNVLSALQDLAKHHRKQLEIPLVGLTGSNGKTTSKELVRAVLQQSYKTFATRGNLNNHIGVPLSILEIDRSIEIAIIEMGANHLSEISFLCEIAQPTHGFITNIGKAHIGSFGGFENIVRAKSELYQYLLDHKGKVFVNSQNPILKKMAGRFDSPYYYPEKSDYCYVQLMEADPFVKIKFKKKEVETHLLGAYNFENIAVALCIGQFFGVDDRMALKAIQGYIPDNNRSQVIKKGTNTIILDAYNANPSSMKAAIENIDQMKALRKVLIIGDMYELGEESVNEHSALGLFIKEKGFKEVYLCGKDIEVVREVFPRAMYFKTREDLEAELEKNLFTNATILIKASRGIGLEKIVEFI